MATQPNTPSRRNLLAGMALALPLAALPLAVPACTPKANAATMDRPAWNALVRDYRAAHAAWEIEWNRWQDSADALDDDPAERKADEAFDILRAELIDFPAPDLAAVLEKMDALNIGGVDWKEIGDSSEIEKAIRADLARFAGKAVA